ncbi:MAG: Mov34/MPN/PAD-1 family protein [Planctomycetaceae bacterium]
MSNQDRPDVRLLRNEKLAESSFPASRAADFRIHFHPAAHGRAVAHAKEDKSVEICGVLVGDWGQDADGPFARITEIIRCDSATKKFAEVTFTHESWTQINREMDTKFANLRIIGWYHSHPNFGIFLSDRDVFIQQNFFGGPGQLAFVVDPVRDAEGVFEWHDGKPVLSSHYWIGGRISGGEATARGGGQVGGPEAARDSGMSFGQPSADSSPRQFESSGLQGGSWLTLAMCVMFFLVGYMLSARRASPWEDARIIEGVSAHFRDWKGAESQARLNEIQNRVADLSAKTAKLSEDHVKLSGDKAKDVTKEWGVVRQDMNECRILLAQLAERYSLSPEDGSIFQAEVYKLVKALAEDAARAEARKAAKKSADEKSKDEKSKDEKSKDEKSKDGKSSDGKSKDEKSSDVKSSPSKSSEKEPPKTPPKAKSDETPSKAKPEEAPKKSSEKSREP